MAQISCSWEAEYFFFLLLGGKISHIFCQWEEEYFIYPVHGKQNMGGKSSHISCSWEAGWWSGWPKVAGVPIGGQEEYGEGAPSGNSSSFANFHVISTFKNLVLV